MAAAKTAYTADQTVELVAAYNAAPTKDTVEAFATKFGKTVKSVVAKLSREGVYKKAEYTNKNGEKPIKKDEFANVMQEFFNLTEAEADSLTKANKTALAKISEKFSEMVETIKALETENEMSEDTSVMTEAEESGDVAEVIGDPIDEMKAEISAE